MIKRIGFVSRRHDVSTEVFSERWPHALTRLSSAPPAARPGRVAACLVMHDVPGTDTPHDGVELLWFTDANHLERFDTWRTTSDGTQVLGAASRVVDPDDTRVVVADESVMRGAEWLERRWSDGGVKLKHMAIALRAHGLTQQEFSHRWRQRAGQLRRAGAASATAIPDEVRGRAYVQNHPLPRAAGNWAYDAVNEVYFDDVDGLRARSEWFGENLRGQAETDLVSQSWFVAAREVVLASTT